MLMKRILVLMLVLGIALCFSVAFAGSEESEEKGLTTLGTSIRSLENPYHANWAKGGDIFAEKVGLPHVVQTCEGSSEKQLNDIKALVAKTGGNLVFNIDPNESPNVVPIAKALEEAGVYFCTTWNKPEDVKVWDYNYWVCHVAFDGRTDGYYIAKELFASFETPYKGKIIALQGKLANTAHLERWAGLFQALDEYPDVELVAYQCAEWERVKAFEHTSSMLVAHPDISGVWAANDNMAMGALEALRAAGLAGKVKVCGIDGIEEMINAILKGEAVATCSPDPYWQGGMLTSIPLAAKNGLIDVKSLPKEKRQWYAKSIRVNSENVSEYIKNYIDGLPEYDYNDYWGNWLGPIK